MYCVLTKAVRIVTRKTQSKYVYIMLAAVGMFNGSRAYDSCCRRTHSNGRFYCSGGRLNMVAVLDIVYKL